MQDIRSVLMKSSQVVWHQPSIRHPPLTAGLKTSWAWWGSGQFQRQNCGYKMKQSSILIQIFHISEKIWAEVLAPQTWEFCYWWIRHGPYPQLFYLELDCNLCEGKNRNPPLSFPSAKNCHNCFGACPCHNKEKPYLYPCPFKKVLQRFGSPIEASQFDYQVLAALAFSQSAWANSASKSSWLDSSTGWTSSVGK